MTVKQRIDTLKDFLGLLGSAVAVISIIVATVWATKGIEAVDARVRVGVAPIEDRVQALENTFQTIEDGFDKNAADHQALMSPSQRRTADQIYQDLRRNRVRMSR